MEEQIHIYSIYNRWALLWSPTKIVKYLKLIINNQNLTLKGLEDFSVNPVTLRGNILRMR